MLTRYIQAAMNQARYELLEDGTFYGEIPPCPGVYANSETLEACRAELQEVLEGWIVLGFTELRKDGSQVMELSECFSKNR